MSLTREQDQIIVEARAQGVPYEKTAVLANCARSTVQNKVAREEIKAKIKAVQERVYDECLDTALNNIKHAINGYRKPGKKVTVRLKDGTEIVERKFDEQLRDHGYKASAKLMEGIGAFPTQNTSIYVGQINQVNVTQIPPVIQEFLEHRKEQMKAIEAEFIEGEVVE